MDMHIEQMLQDESISPKDPRLTQKFRLSSWFCDGMMAIINTIEIAQNCNSEDAKQTWENIERTKLFSQDVKMIEYQTPVTSGAMPFMNTDSCIRLVCILPINCKRIDRIVQIICAIDNEHARVRPNAIALEGPPRLKSLANVANQVYNSGDDCTSEDGDDEDENNDEEDDKEVGDKKNENQIGNENENKNEDDVVFVEPKKSERPKRSEREQSAELDLAKSLSKKRGFEETVKLLVSAHVNKMRKITELEVLREHVSLMRRETEARVYEMKARESLMRIEMEAKQREMKQVHMYHPQYVNPYHHHPNLAYHQAMQQQQQRQQQQIPSDHPFH